MFAHSELSSNVATFFGRRWQRQAFLIAGSIIFAGGVALGLAALAGDTNLSEQTIAADPGIETVWSGPATRSSFMASWNAVAGANGYLLDVSTSDSFSSYVEGYHGLDVGNVTGRVVTGLHQGTTYYYRVRPYGTSATGSHSEAKAISTVSTAGLTIQATFDNSITS
jgi:hypothetical protein